MICVWKVNSNSGQGSLEHALKCPGLLPMSGRSFDENICEHGEGILCVLSKIMPGLNMVGST